MMRGREVGKGPPPSADLLVCFPSRAHRLSLMPKPICSPARPPEPSSMRHHRPQHRRRKSAGGASPLYWAKNRSHAGSDISSEPTSPKVTCAGQIKVRHHKPRPCKNWQSVMEEIERLHNNNRKKQKKRSSSAWTEALRFKKEAMQFLTCLRNIRFDFRCFGAFPSTAVISSDDDDEDEEEDDDDDDHEEEDAIRRRFGSKEEEEVEEKDQSSDVFSKWFMILQDQEEDRKGKMVRSCLDDDDEEEEEGGDDAATAPPANALLLMRCRSAPAKSWQEEREREEREKREKEKREDDEKEDHERKQRLVVMRCGAHQFSKLSADIAKETWVVGGIRDDTLSLSRSRSWKR